MTVSSEIDSVQYTLPSVLVPLPVTFRFLEEADLRVVHAPISGTTPVELTLNTDYTVTGARTQGGGTVTLLIATNAGDTVSIDRGNMARTQLIDYRANDPFPEEDAEDGLDRLTMLLQQSGIDGGRRSLTLFPTDPTTGGRYNANSNRIVGLADGVDPTDAATLQQVTALGSGNFIQSGSGSQIRTMQDKVRERVSVLDFIPVAEHAAIKAGTTTYDATADIQSAINSISGGGAVYFPDGVYRISAALSISSAGVTLYGDSFGSTSIRQTTNNVPIISSAAGRTMVRDLLLQYIPTPVAGAIAINLASTDARINCVYIANCYTGVYTTGGSGLMIDSLQVQNYVYAGVHCQSVNDVYCAKFIFNAGNATNGAGGAIRLEDKVEAAVFTDGDVLLGVYSLVCTSALNTVGNRPAYNNFTNVYFDSAAQGSTITNLVETEFVGCWFSGGRSGGGFPGLALNVSDSVHFVATRFFNCGGHGCQVGSGAVRTTFVACSFEANSVTAGVGVSHGLTFSASTTDWSVIGGKAHNGLFAGQQGYGIFINASCDRFSIRDVQVSGNATGGIQDGSSNGADKTISGCKGYVTQSKGSSNVAIGQTVATVTHGLAATPGLDDIVVMPTGLMSASGITSWRILNPTSTNFQVQTNAAVSGANFTFSWKVRIKGD